MAIQHEGLTLHPLTPAVIQARPEFDPWQHDELILRNRPGGWIDFEDKQHAPRLIRSVCRPGDALYYWDVGSALWKQRDRRGPRWPRDHHVHALGLLTQR